MNTPSVLCNIQRSGVIGALRQAAFPIEGGFHDVFQIVVPGLPVQDVAYALGAGHHPGDIAGAPARSSTCM